mmetsp:Transcript_13983/g.36112  ORF Transcript_13983/g.36112 Transcript_13983/m.36112 type:complete len:319 (-) Transcript_13983:570-1526(-)
MASHDPERDTDEECEDDGEALEWTPPPVNCMRQRASVSAEAFGEWNKRGDFVAPVYPKSDEQIAELMNTLRNSFLFHSLEPKDLQVVTMAMKGPHVLEPGHRIINEGDSGDHLYVVTDGAMDCAKVLGEPAVEIVVKTCVKGDLFGELALLYNCPRAASVICRDLSVLWELDRGSFTNIVMESVQRKRATCGEVLRRVPLFAGLTPTALESIIDALKVMNFPAGTVIIQQGDLGDVFFFIYEGEAVASRATPENPEPSQFLHQAGDYFGELALLRNEPRAASVTSTTDVKLFMMDSATFKRLMGPAEGFLQQQVARYS